MTAGPLLVYGPRSLDYDFGAGHPLTPRRFGPGIDLLRAVGAEPGLAPEPATDAELLRLHDPGYVAALRRFSTDVAAPPGWGIGPGDDPPFSGMHDAAAAVAGGSLGAMAVVLRGDTDHAFHPGGGLHHAMRDRASGFCLYNDPALAIARARDAGRRVLYVDLDVHHGDGVEALLADDADALTVSIHESGRWLFPGTGAVSETGRGTAASSIVNVPLPPGTGAEAWLAAVRAVVPVVAAAFGPDVVVSQHGADAHAWDPLAHLRVTVDAMGAAARMVDTIAHRHADGRWLATGGGGYDVYRVVPRAWVLVWLAGAHREPPAATPPAWRDRWAAEAARVGQLLPASFHDDLAPHADARADATAAEAGRMALRARSAAVPALLAEAIDRGWWRPAGADDSGPGNGRDEAAGAARGGSAASAGTAPDPAGVHVVDPLDCTTLDGLVLPPRILPPADPLDARAILVAALEAGGHAVAAVAGDRIVGVTLTVPGRPSNVTLLEEADGAVPRTAGGAHRLVSIGVAPAARGTGIARRLVLSVVARADDERIALWAAFGPGERDPFGPLPLDTRMAIACSLLDRAGFGRIDAPGALDPRSIVAVRPAR